MVVDHEFVASLHLIVILPSFRPRCPFIQRFVCTSAHISIRVGASVPTTASPTGT